MTYDNIQKTITALRSEVEALVSKRDAATNDYDRQRYARLIVMREQMIQKSEAALTRPRDAGLPQS